MKFWLAPIVVWAAVGFISHSSFAADTGSGSLSGPSPSPSSTPDAALEETTTVLPDTYPVKAATSPAATPAETIPVAPAATLAPTVAPTVAPIVKASPITAPTSTPKLTATPTGKEANSKQAAACKEVFPSTYQEKLRVACSDGAEQSSKTGWANAAAQCRANHKLGLRQQLMCQVGASIGDELKNSKTNYVERAGACRDLFPINSPVDVYFQESCLSGADLQAHSRGKATIGNCRWLVPNDRGFLGPCAAGISLTASLNSSEKTVGADLNKMCSQYFDKAQFNLGYRSCLNGLALTLSSDDKKFDVVHRCGELTGDNGGSERASCIVGFELSRYMRKTDDLGRRLKTCGDAKVNYEQRDTLSCLTAVSLTDFMSTDRARKACKEIFTGRKNHSRADCERRL